MEVVLLSLHVLFAIAIIALVLLQQGKGADAGAAFGGGGGSASQTVFGSQGSGNFLTKSTSTLAILFFATSLGLAMYAKQQAENAEQAGLPQVQEQVEAPVLEEPAELPAIENAVDEVPQVSE